MTPHLPIYMDYGATTPVDPRVVDAMVPWLREHFGNPASRSHAWGWEAEEAVERARGQALVAQVLDRRGDARERTDVAGRGGQRLGLACELSCLRLRPRIRSGGGPRH